MGLTVVIGGCNDLGSLVIDECQTEVVVTSRSDKRAKEFADEAGPRVTGTSLDLQSDANIHGFFRTLKQPVSSLVHLAVARREVKDDLAYSMEDWEAELRINVTSAYACAVAASRHMKSGGSIILTGSIYGRVAVDHSVYPDGMAQSPITYAVSKAATAHLTRELAVILAPENVRVNCLSFGGIEADQPTEFKRNYCRKVPQGRMARYNDLRPAIKFLLDPKNRYFTGQELMVDGGFTAW